jgi:HAD superfamily hydrolase (TIGR01509 family)
VILFDFDGVLVDSEPVHYSCWYELLRNAGVELTWEAYHTRFSGISHLGLIEQFAELRDPPVPMEQMWEIYGHKQQMYRQETEDGHLLTPAIRELVRSLDGYRLGVVTSSARADVETQLRNAGIRDCFEVVVCRDDVKALKPAPDLYLRAMELLGIRHALVLEDSAPGMAAARAAQLEVLSVVNSRDVPALLAGRLGNALLS